MDSRVVTGDQDGGGLVRAQAGVADRLARGASTIMAASELINLSGLLDDAKCFAFVR